MSSQNVADPSFTAATTAKRKIMYVMKACNTCRRRKSKCDGNAPCGNCKQNNRECIYAEGADGRQLASKTLVYALQARNKVLEKLLDDNGIPHRLENLSDDLGKLPKPRILGDDEEEQIDSDGGNQVEVQRLKIDDTTGELLQFGPTSAWSHVTPSTNYAPIIASQSPSAAVVFASPDESELLPTVMSPVNLVTQTRTSAGDIDWSRNLPYVEGLDAALHEQLVQLFFNYFNTWCCWTQENLFRRDMAICLGSLRGSKNTPERTSNYSPLLHNAILGIACFYCDDPRVSSNLSNSKRVVWRFAQSAKDAIDVEVDRPLIATVQGLMLLGSLHSGAGKQGLGYHFAGAGLRLATTLGLGIDSTSSLRKGLITNEMKATREMAFWCCYIQDKLWSMYVGRGASITTSQFETALPQIFKQLDDILWRPRLDEPNATDLSIPVESWISTTFHQTAKLAVLAERVLEAVYALKVNLHSAKVHTVVSDLHLQLETWRSELPPAVQISSYSKKSRPSHVIMLHQMHWFLSILLHRPFVPRPESSPKEVWLLFSASAAQQCEVAATKVVQLLQLYRQIGLKYAPVSLTQITFTAGTIELLSAARSDRGADPKRYDSAMATAQTCVECLEEMPWECSRQSANILNKLISDQVAAHQVGVAMKIRKQVSVSNEKFDLTSALDSNSELAQQLKAMGWVPPFANSMAAISATSTTSSTLHAQIDALESSSRQKEISFPKSEPALTASSVLPPLTAYDPMFQYLQGEVPHNSKSTMALNEMPQSLSSPINTTYPLPYSSLSNLSPSSFNPIPTPNSSFLSFGISTPFSEESMMSFFDRRNPFLGLGSPELLGGQEPSSPIGYQRTEEWANFSGQSGDERVDIHQSLPVRSGENPVDQRNSEVNWN